MHQVDVETQSLILRVGHYYIPWGQPEMTYYHKMASGAKLLSMQIRNSHPFLSPHSE